MRKIKKIKKTNSTKLKIFAIIPPPPTSRPKASPAEIPCPSSLRSVNQPLLAAFREPPLLATFRETEGERGGGFGAGRGGGVGGGLESLSRPEASHPSSPFSSNTSTRGDFGAIVGSGHSPEAHPDQAPASQVADGSAVSVLRKPPHK